MPGPVAERMGGQHLPVSEPSPDIAERLAAWGGGLRATHRRLVAGLCVGCCVATCVGLLLLVLAFVLVPSTRDGVAALLGAAWLVGQVAFLAPSRTLSFVSLMRVCALGAVVAIPIGLAEVGLGRLVGWEPTDVQAELFVAGPVEEVLKLLPLALVGAVAWHRIRRFSAADFLVVGAAAGAGFQLTEDLIRRITTSPGFLASVYMDGPNLTNYGPLTLFPGWGQYDGVEFAGHGVTTAMVAAGIGIAVMGQRWRGWLVPVLLLCWVIFDHTVFNSIAGLGGFVMSDAMTWVHTALGAGNANRYLLLMLLAIAVATDFKAINSVERYIPPVMPLVGRAPRDATVSATPVPAGDGLPTGVRPEAGAIAELAAHLKVCWGGAAGRAGRVRDRLGHASGSAGAGGRRVPGSRPAPEALSADPPTERTSPPPRCTARGDRSPCSDVDAPRH
jgi:RsiW-degrading membrane proteinase PrsW (M82 family)